MWCVVLTTMTSSTLPVLATQQEIEIINLELALADLAQIERRMVAP